MNAENNEGAEQSMGIKVKIRLALLKATFWGDAFSPQ